MAMDSQLLSWRVSKSEDFHFFRKFLTDFAVCKNFWKPFSQLISVNKTKLIFPLQGKPYGITFIDHVVSKMFDYHVNVYSPFGSDIQPPNQAKFPQHKTSVNYLTCTRLAQNLASSRSQLV